jgi:hypothetical protein
MDARDGRGYQELQIRTTNNVVPLAEMQVFLLRLKKQITDTMVWWLCPGSENIYQQFSMTS